MLEEGLPHLLEGHSTLTVLQTNKITDCLFDKRCEQVAA